MSFLQSIFTPQGYNQQKQQQTNNINTQNQVSSLLPGEVNYENELQGIRQNELPNMTNAINGLFQFTNQSGRNQLVNSFGQQQTAGAQDAAANASSTFAGNPGLAKAFQLSSLNQGNTNTANYSQNINSPQAESQALSTAVGAAGAINPNYSGVGQIASETYGSPTAQVSGGLNSLMQLIGALSGSGGLSSLTGGK